MTDARGEPLTSLEGASLAAVVRSDRICNGVKFSDRRADMRTAAAPAMNGVAIEVPAGRTARQHVFITAESIKRRIERSDEPEIVPVPPRASGKVERMFPPGADRVG